jgi:hypothetical protein
MVEHVLVVFLIFTLISENGVVALSSSGIEIEIWGRN